MKVRPKKWAYLTLKLGGLNPIRPELFNMYQPGC